MWHSGIRVVQDPVHGLMEFMRSEALVIDLLRSSELQRLRRIKQLGFAAFVFPGAEHSRFPHALGTAYVAARVARHLDAVGRELLPPTFRLDPHAIQEFCVAGLCHDLGHGPFSHVWERVVVGEDWKRDLWIKALGIEGANPSDFANWHEMVTYALLVSPDGDLHRILEQYAQGMSERVAKLLTNHYHLGYLSRLLSGDVDVDRCDYLLRDAFMAGIPSCGYQLDRLIACLTFGTDATGRIWVGLNEKKGLPVALELMHSRSELYRILYLHKTVLGMEWLLWNFLKRLRYLSEQGHRLRGAEGVPAAVLAMIRGEPVGLDGIMKLDDYTIWSLITQATELTDRDPTAMGLANLILQRDPLRTVRLPGDRIEAFFAPDHTARERLVADAVAKYVEGDAAYFIAHRSMTIELREEDEAKGTYLITGDERRTKPLSSHSRITTRFPKAKVTLPDELFVHRDAREAVEKLLAR